MLKKLREKKTAKKIWVILAIIIIPAFVLWGSGSLIRSKQRAEYSGNVGKIFGRNVSFAEFKDAYTAAKAQALLQLGEKFSELEKYLNLEAQAWERLLLLNEAKRQKITANDSEVIKIIKGDPAFQKNGRFNNQIYSQMITYILHIKPRQFEEQTRQNLIISKLYKSVTADVKVTDEEIREEYRKLNEEISLYYIASLALEFEKEVAINDGEIKDYYAKNSLQFKQPPSFNLGYISLIAEEKNEKETADKVNTLTSRIAKGEDFAKLAKEYNMEIKETGFFSQMDPIPGIGWAQEMQSQITKAKPGDFLPVLHMDKNYYILKVKERKESYIPDFEAVKDKVREALIKDRSKTIAGERIENCLKKIKELHQTNPKPINLEKSAQECGLKSGSTDFFKYRSYIEGIGASDNFYLKARDLKEDEFSPAIETPTGFYIVKLKSKKGVDEERFAKEKADLHETFLGQKRQKHFLEFTQELRNKSTGLY